MLHIQGSPRGEIKPLILHLLLSGITGYSVGWRGGRLFCRNRRMKQPPGATHLSLQFPNLPESPQSAVLSVSLTRGLVSRIQHEAVLLAGPHQPGEGEERRASELQSRAREHPSLPPPSHVPRVLLCHPAASGGPSHPPKSQKAAQEGRSSPCAFPKLARKGGVKLYPRGKKFSCKSRPPREAN